MKEDPNVKISNIIKHFACISLLILALSYPVHSQLNVSENGRHLVDANGNPFFWLGDTGWALFQKLNREEVEFYFESRAQQGFSVIHAAVLTLILSFYHPYQMYMEISLL